LVKDDSKLPAILFEDLFNNALSQIKLVERGMFDKVKIELVLDQV